MLAGTPTRRSCLRQDEEDGFQEDKCKPLEAKLRTPSVVDQ